MVVDDYAIADWIQANKVAGRYWSSSMANGRFICGGKGLVSASNLQAAGLQNQPQTQLATALQRRKTISKERGISLF